jgi:D-alanyl-D-alanine carboxypeptidase
VSGSSRRLLLLTAVVSTVLCSLLAPSAGIAASAQAKRTEPAFAAKLRPLLEAELQRMGVHGAVVHATVPGEGTWTAGLGIADPTTGAPMTANTYLRVGSITKTFTATVILQLVDRGKIQLDAPVSRYLSGVPNGANITIRQLLNMKSGLYNYTLGDFLSQLRANPQRAWAPSELLSIAFSNPPDFPPGAGWNYSNTNYILLGQIIERLTNQPVEQAIKQYVLTPLGMNHTFLPPRTSSSIPNPHPRSYMWWSETEPMLETTDWNPSWAWTAGSAISTAGDLSIWAKALVTGRLLRPETQRERLEWITVDPSVRYGLGIAEFDGMVGHDGGMPGFESYMCVEPNQRITIIALTNGYPELDHSGHVLANVMRQELVEPTVSASVRRLDLGRYSGLDGKLRAAR